MVQLCTGDLILKQEIRVLVVSAVRSYCLMKIGMNPIGQMSQHTLAVPTIVTVKPSVGYDNDIDVYLLIPFPFLNEKSELPEVYTSVCLVGSQLKQGCPSSISSLLRVTNSDMALMYVL